MSTLHSLATGSAVGGFLPLLTAVVQRPAWSVRFKKVVAVAMALFGGAVTVAAVGGLEQFSHGLPTVATIGAVVAASQSAYDLIWKPTSIAPAIESATSPKAASVAG